MVKKLDKSGKKQAVRDDSPILNSPYDAPSHHYATTVDGELNYNDVRPGRRIFSPQTPQVPLGQQAQSGLYDLNDHAANYQSELVNLLREQLGRWRQAGYPDVTSRVTRDLLEFWFLNAERPDWKRLFFAQQEAVETAIWLNEVAHKSNVGTHVLDRLRLANESVEDPASVLPRIAFKMATGTGNLIVEITGFAKDKDLKRYFTTERWLPAVNAQVFFCGGDKDEFTKFKKGLQSLAVASTKKAAEQTLKIELDDEAFERLYGFVSHPVQADKGRKLAVRVISQFGEESTKVLVL